MKLDKDLKIAILKVTSAYRIGKRSLKAPTPHHTDDGIISFF